MTSEPHHYGIDEPLDSPPITLLAHKKKSGDAYLQRVAPQHLIALRYLRQHYRATASQMSFASHSY